MSIKKELLNKLTEKQLRELADDKGIKFKLSKRQKKYYLGWEEKDKIVDIMTDTADISVKDIEEFIKLQNI